MGNWPVDLGARLKGEAMGFVAEMIGMILIGGFVAIIIESRRIDYEIMHMNDGPLTMEEAKKEKRK